MEPYRTMLADEPILFRQGIKRIIDQIPGRTGGVGIRELAAQHQAFEHSQIHPLGKSFMQ
jgi:hypothetical protein